MGADRLGLSCQGTKGLARSGAGGAASAVPRLRRRRLGSAYPSLFSRYAPAILAAALRLGRSVATESGWELCLGIGSPKGWGSCERLQKPQAKALDNSARQYGSLKGECGRATAFGCQAS